MPTLPHELLSSVADIAQDGGRAALEYYGDSSGVEYKADNSPLTLADKAAHARLVELLRDLTPEIPVLSEESPEDETIGRKSWSEFWLVDPLDGSKEFIKQTGEFTVNIALVRGSEPVLGVVHVPVTGVTYLGRKDGPGSEDGGNGGSDRDDGEGAWKVEKDGVQTAMRTRSAKLDRLTVVASRDHAGPVVEAFLSRLSGADVTSMGSSLKFCLIAEGRADFYPRVVPTMEWDTGAAQCIVEAAGGRVTTLDGVRLAYNKNDLRNPSVMAFGDPNVDWPTFFVS